MSIRSLERLLVVLYIALAWSIAFMCIFTVGALTVGTGNILQQIGPGACGTVWVMGNIFLFSAGVGVAIHGWRS